jgi:hypothetical protein
MENDIPVEVLVRGLALGSAFVVIFSPASQSAAFILYAPLVMDYFRQGAVVPKRLQKVWIVGLVISWFFISLMYSDLVGFSVRTYAMEHALKPLGALILLGFYIGFDVYLNSRPSKHFYGHS